MTCRLVRRIDKRTPRHHLCSSSQTVKDVPNHLFWEMMAAEVLVLCLPSCKPWYILLLVAVASPQVFDI